MPSEALESKIFVGNPDSPVAFIKRKEVEGFIDDTFFRQYNLWKKYHHGFGLPLEKSWANHPSFLIDIIELFELEFMEMQAANRSEQERATKYNNAAKKKRR